mmetsp:Transcript_6362/g.9278  ORF Transcript_6362/g.9278 Transcript_6362/m.9278 type:complete len:108 (+) Transcript_6362:49-372(+)
MQTNKEIREKYNNSKKGAEKGVADWRAAQAEKWKATHPQQQQQTGIARGKVTQLTGKKKKKGLFDNLKELFKTEQKKSKASTTTTTNANIKTIKDYPKPKKNCPNCK